MKFGNSVQIHGERSSPQKGTENVFRGRTPDSEVQEFRVRPRNTPIPLKPDIDAAFEQFGVLAELRVLGTETLIQYVAGVDNGLDLAGEHAPRR